MIEHFERQPVFFCRTNPPEQLGWIRKLFGIDRDKAAFGSIKADRDDMSEGIGCAEGTDD